MQIDPEDFKRYYALLDVVDRALAFDGHDLQASGSLTLGGKAPEVE